MIFPSRTETRKERYSTKLESATSLPFSVACTNFSFDQNVAFLARAVACFGGRTVHIIGKIPQRKVLAQYSGGHSDLLTFYSHQTPADFIAWCRENRYKIVAIELDDGAVNIHDFQFSPAEAYMFVVGNEMEGVPVEIIKAADHLIYIPMPGFGYCLNTSQTGNVILYEYAKQIEAQTNKQTSFEKK